MENSETRTEYGPALSVLGVSKGHALRAQKWLRNRGFLSFYLSQDKSLNVLECKHGHEWTYAKLEEALKATA